MKLFVLCRNCGTKNYLAIAAGSRQELTQKVGYEFTLRCASCGLTHSYYVTDVKAEASSGIAGAGAIVGGILGAILGGGVGAGVGAALGAVVGGGGEVEDKKKADRFNAGVGY